MATVKPACYCYWWIHESNSTGSSDIESNHGLDDIEKVVVFFSKKYKIEVWKQSCKDAFVKNEPLEPFISTLKWYFIVSYHLGRSWSFSVGMLKGL